MVPDEEAVSLATLISAHEGIAIKVTSRCINKQLRNITDTLVKGEDLITILNAAGIKVNQYHSNFAAILEKVRHPMSQASWCAVLMLT